MSSSDTTTIASKISTLSNSIPSIVNNLTSTSTTSALSAAQGKALNDKVGSVASGNKYVAFATGNYSDINFGKTFNVLPIVFVNITDQGGLEKSGFQGCACIDRTNVTNITTTGCRIWHERADNSSNGAFINWIAYAPYY